MAYNPKNDPNYMRYNNPYTYAQYGGPMGGALIDIGAPILGTENIAPGRIPGAGTNSNGGLAGMFARAKSGVGNWFNNATGGVKNTFANVKTGKGIMPKYAGLANVGMGIGAGLSAIQGINDYQTAKQDTDDLVNDILQSAAGNPNIRYDLSSDQLQTLRKLQNGTYDTSGDFELSHLLGNLGETATGAGFGFLTGGPLGAVLGGAGGLAKGISSGMVGNQEQITADLQSLYDALYESEMNAKAIRRDAAMQRYANSLYY
jgi:hypothetical protein